MMTRWWLIGLLLCAMSGCASVASLVQDLNDRQVQSCVEASGSYGVFVMAHITMATGGATLEECKKLR